MTTNDWPFLLVSNQIQEKKKRKIIPKRNQSEKCEIFSIRNSRNLFAVPSFSVWIINCEDLLATTFRRFAVNFFVSVSRRLFCETSKQFKMRNNSCEIYWQISLFWLRKIRNRIEFRSINFLCKTLHDKKTSGKSLTQAEKKSRRTMKRSFSFFFVFDESKRKKRKSLISFQSRK